MSHRSRFWTAYFSLVGLAIVAPAAALVISIVLFALVIGATAFIRYVDRSIPHE